MKQLILALFATIYCGEFVSAGIIFSDNFDAEGIKSNAADLTNWTAVVGNVDVIDTSPLQLPGVSPSQGLFVDLDGNQSGTIESKQVFSLGTGDYRLTFDVAGSHRYRPNYPYEWFFANVVDQSTGDNLVDLGYAMYHADPFRTITHEFSLSVPTDIKLKFGAAPNVDRYVGPLLDNVLLESLNLESVPEPTTFAIWSLLGGIGLAVGHRRRRRRGYSASRR